MSDFFEKLTCHPHKTNEDFFLALALARFLLILYYVVEIIMALLI